MISLAMAWVVVQALKEPRTKTFEFSFQEFLVTGTLDVLMVLVLGNALKGGC